MFDLRYPEHEVEPDPVKREVLKFYFMLLAVLEAAKHRPELLASPSLRRRLDARFLAAVHAKDADAVRGLTDELLDGIEAGAWQGLWTKVASECLAPRPKKPIDAAGIPYVRRGRDPSRGLDCWGLVSCLRPDLPRMFFHLGSPAVDAALWAAITDPKRRHMRLAEMISVHGQDPRWRRLSKPEVGCLVWFLQTRGIGEDHVGLCEAGPDGEPTVLLHMVDGAGLRRWPINTRLHQARYYLRWEPSPSAA